MDKIKRLGYHEYAGAVVLYKLPTGIAVGSRTHCLSDILQPLSLAHGLLAANHYGVGIVNDPVTDGICQKRVGQFLRPSRDVKLGTEDRGVLLVPGLVLADLYIRLWLLVFLGGVSRHRFGDGAADKSVRGLAHGFCVGIDAGLLASRDANPQIVKFFVVLLACTQLRFCLGHGNHTPQRLVYNIDRKMQ